jgi:hypothetical protein
VGNNPQNKVDAWGLDGVIPAYIPQSCCRTYTCDPPLPPIRVKTITRNILGVTYTRVNWVCVYTCLLQSLDNCPTSDTDIGMEGIRIHTFRGDEETSRLTPFGIPVAPIVPTCPLNPERTSCYCWLKPNFMF